MYINVEHILSQNFKWYLLMGGRGIGKTYGFQKFLIRNCLKKKTEFAIITRTVESIENDVLKKSLTKVLDNEFKDLDLIFNKREGYYNIEKNGKKEKVVLCRIFALSEYSKIKKESYPNIRWLFFDEFILEEIKGLRSGYVGGFDEPDTLINIYNTIDREEDRVRVIMLCNTITSVNPYFIHDFFKIPPLKKGQRFKNGSVVAMFLLSSDELNKKRETNSFIKQVKETSYNDYITGDYIEETDSFIATTKNKTFKMYNISVLDNLYSFDFCFNDTYIYVTESKDVTFKTFCLSLDGINENVMILDETTSNYKYLKKAIKQNKIRYSNQKVKMIVQKELYKLL